MFTELFVQAEKNALWLLVFSLFGIVALISMSILAKRYRSAYNINITLGESSFKDIPAVVNIYLVLYLLMGAVVSPTIYLFFSKADGQVTWSVIALVTLIKVVPGIWHLIKPGRDINKISIELGQGILTVVIREVLCGYLVMTYQNIWLGFAVHILIIPFTLIESLINDVLISIVLNPELRNVLISMVGIRRI